MDARYRCKRVGDSRLNEPDLPAKPAALSAVVSGCALIWDDDARDGGCAVQPVSDRNAERKCRSLKRKRVSISHDNDENLLDELIATLYQEMMSLDQPRAERVMGLIIRRHRDAKDALKAMLNDFRAGRNRQKLA